MADAVEVAAESALLNRYTAIAAVLGIDETRMAYPNKTFTKPDKDVAPFFYLRATNLPADSVALSVDVGGDNQHYGIFQVDVFYKMNAGGLAPKRIASSVSNHFQRGLVLAKDGFRVELQRLPYHGTMIDSDPWVMIPVSIPYFCYAPIPA
jgi:hypothetical protein